MSLETCNKFCYRCKSSKPESEFYKNQNRCKPCSSVLGKEIRRRNPEETKKKDLKHRLNSREKRRLWKRQNRERLYKESRAYFAKNKEKWTNYKKVYRKENKEHLNNLTKEWAQENREWIKERNKLREQSIPSIKLVKSLRARIRNLLTGTNKSKSTLKLLGCCRETFKQYLECFFAPGMSWDNYGLGPGKWHIGHVIHCSEFDLRLPKEQAKCFHYSNMRPEWGTENLSKNDITKDGRRARNTPRIFRSEDGLEEVSQELNWIS